MILNAKIPGCPNFKYYEFIKSETAIRHNIDNTPTEEQWKSIELLARNVLQPIRNEFGPIHILSGFRSVALNILIGGSKYSNHCRGEAADIEPWNSDIPLLDIVKFINNTLDFRTVIFEYPKYGWVHVDYREGENLKKLKLKDSNHNYTEMSLLEIEKIYG